MESDKLKKFIQKEICPGCPMNTVQVKFICSKRDDDYDNCPNSITQMMKQKVEGMDNGNKILA